MPVPAYKLGYLIRDALALRACDSLSRKQADELSVKNLLNESFRKQNLSLTRENKKLIQKDSAHEVRYSAANDVYLIDKQELKRDKRTWIWVSVIEGIGIVSLIALVLLL